MNGTRALMIMQDVAIKGADTMSVISSYIVRTSDGEYHVVVVDRMEDLRDEVGFYTVDDISGTYKLLNFIGLSKDKGPEEDYSAYLESQGYTVVARFRPCLQLASA